MESSNKLLEHVRDHFGIVLLLKMFDLVFRETDFLQMTDESLPNRGPLFPFAEIEFGDGFLRLLQPNRISIAVVILDHFFLISAALWGHGDFLCWMGCRM